MQFTKEQQAVINHEDGNLLVSAAAGSGKTAVLVERIIRMALSRTDPVPLDQILVVTFTSAAARQMREKISERIRGALEENPQDDFLQQQYHALPLASIMTSHAFCLQVLQDYITRIPGLDPGFRVADETEIELLRVDVLSQVLEEFYTEALAPEASPDSRDFLAFMDAYGGSRQDVQVEELLLGIYRFMESDPDPVGWLEKAVRQLDPDTWQQDNVWTQAAAQEVRQAAEEGMEALRLLCCQLQEAAEKKPKEAGKAGKLIQQLQQSVQSIADSADAPASELSLACRSAVWPRMSYTLFKDDPAAEALAKDTTAQMKEAFRKAGSIYAIFWDEAALKRQKQLILPAMRGMEQLLKAFDCAYRQAKTEKNLVEFSDFEHDALQILQDDAVSEDFRRQYRYIYIDEYQDSNPLQEAIMERIARKDENGQSCNIFMVGDVKQSIYRFRQADPSLFMEKYKTYGTRPNTRRLVLGRNFRSERPVLDAVNFIFEALMREESGELEYGEVERLYPGLPEQPQAPSAELRVLETDREDSRQRLEAEAQEAADYILQRTAEGADYRDVVILLRSVSGAGEVYRQVLEQNGIPAYTETSESFYDTQEIRTVMNLLHVLDNPHQDIPLMGVLYSPVVGMTESELGMVRLAAMDHDFYDALTAFGRQDREDAAHQKVRGFLRQTERWRQMAQTSTIHDLLWTLLEETGYYLYASSMPGGALRRANLDLLLEKSIAFEKGIYSGLYQFLRYVEKMDRYQKTQDEAKSLNEDENLVRIMTIHKSKGLQFPIVILGGLGRSWNRKDLNRSVLLHRSMGIGTDAVDSRQYVRYPSMTKEAIRYRLQREMAAEEMRLLYVGMTRAQKRLLLLGCRKEKKRAAAENSTWRMPVSQALSAGCCLDWVETIVQKKTGSPFWYQVRSYEPKEAEPALQQTPAEEKGRNEQQPADRLLGWTYPYIWRSQVPVRLSVSQIKQRRMEQEPEFQDETAYFVQAESSQQPLGGADRGTAFHTAMAQLSLNAMQDDAMLERELQEMARSGRISDEELQLLPRRWIRGFAGTGLYRRMLRAQQVYREKPFMMSMSLTELAELASELSYGEGSESVMVQGMIDCCFKEQDGWILVDYKTDRELDEAKLEGYRVQLALYARAMAQATGCPVAQRILYDVRREREIEC